MQSELQADRDRLTAQVRQLQAEGLSYGKIGKALGISARFARKLCLADVRPRIITQANAMAFVQEVWRLRNQGLPDTQIAKKLDVPYSSLRKWAGPSGVADKTTERKAKVWQMLDDGLPWRDIVERSGEAESTISSWIRQYRKKA